MKRLLISLILLSACNVPAPNLPNESPALTPSGKPQEAATKPSIFSNALSNRSLSLDLFQENGKTSSKGAAQESAAAPTADNAVADMVSGAPANAPTPEARADIAEGKMMAPWYGGGEFNQYVLQYAEESLFPAANSKTLLKAYQEMVAPLMLEWDAKARLIESRANLGEGTSKEMVYYLPGLDGSPTQTKINFLFRLASSDRKETLVVYMTDKETHVHRMVWGSPNIDISTVKIDSNQAKELALKALRDQSLKGQNSYPQDMSADLQVFYDIPEDAQWQLYLNQQGQKSAVYYVHVNFDAKIDMSNNTGPDPNIEIPPPPGLDDAMQDEYIREQQKELSGVRRLYASVQIDAQSGKIINLDRPIYNFPRIYLGKPVPVSIAPPDAPPPELATVAVPTAQ